LIEVQSVQQIVQLPVLLLLLEHDVVLDESVQRQLGLVVHVDLHRVPHELLADGPDLGAQRRGEHHHLLVVRRLLEDGLHVGTHIDRLQALVALVDDKVAQVRQIKRLLLRQRLDPTRRSHDDMRALARVLQHLPVLLHRKPSEEVTDPHVLHVGRKTLILVANLERQLARMTQDQHAHLAVHRLELLERRDDKDGRLSHARLGLADDVHTENRLRNALMLHLGRVLETAVLDGPQQLGLEEEILETRTVDPHEPLFRRRLHTRVSSTQ